MNKRRLYFSCALSGLPEDHRQAMIEVRSTLQPHFEVMEFCDASTPPAEIFHHDINVCVAGCDLVVAMCDYPSVGLGYEMGTALELHGKPVLALAAIDARVSSLVLGIPHKNFSFRRYSDISNVRDMVLAFEKEIFG